MRARSAKLRPASRGLSGVLFGHASWARRRRSFAFAVGSSARRRVVRRPRWPSGASLPILAREGTGSHARAASVRPSSSRLLRRSPVEHDVAASVLGSRSVFAASSLCWTYAYVSPATIVADGYLGLLLQFGSERPEGDVTGFTQRHPRAIRAMAEKGHRRPAARQPLPRPPSRATRPKAFARLTSCVLRKTNKLSRQPIRRAPLGSQRELAQGRLPMAR